MARRLRRLGRGCKRTTGRPITEPRGEPPDGLPLLQQPLTTGGPRPRLTLERTRLTLPACSTARRLQSVRTADRRCRGGCSRTLCGGCDHQVRKTSLALAVAGGRSGNVVRGLDIEPLRGDQPFQDGSNPSPGQTIGSFQHPDELDYHLAADERGPFGGEIFKERSGSQCLLCVVVHQIADENVGIERDHSMAA